ncbi:MAG: ABC transporter permease [Chlamydiae bacterium]|jgi:phospholipid/cholesterol/gamma-HCH transport system permease protein|nr:ABC transporter permease [Chlamydiota bacterium]
MQTVVSQFKFLISVGEYVSFVATSFATIFRRLPRWSLLREQLYSIGVLSLSVVSLTGFSTGLVLATQSYYQLYNKGLVGVTGLMVAKAMLTELGPVLTAFMFVGRIGASITAELATMKVTEQVDAMISMAVDPQRYLVSPRLISGLIMLPLLTVYSVVLGVFGGYLIAVQFFGLAPTTFWDPIPIYVEPFDFWIGFIKSLVFALLSVTICCFKGMTTTGGAKDVGESTTKAVVLCYVMILILNFFLTLSLNVMRSEIIRWFQ